LLKTNQVNWYSDVSAFLNTSICWLFAKVCDFNTGFISIDCGIPDDSSYTDEKTNMKYVSDLGFVESGTSHSIVSDLQTTSLERQFQNVRSFPEGKRNCYDIRPQQGKGFKYLIRTRFMYGNYDGFSKTPEFDLYIGANLWESVVLINETAIMTKEIIYTPPSDHIHVCLVDKNRGTPFLSVLEIRFLKNDTYDTPYEALMLGRRWDFGTATNLQIRGKHVLFFCCYILPAKCNRFVGTKMISMIAYGCLISLRTRKL